MAFLGAWGRVRAISASRNAHCVCNTAHTRTCTYANPFPLIASTSRLPGKRPKQSAPLEFTTALVRAELPKFPDMKKAIWQEAQERPSSPGRARNAPGDVTRRTCPPSARPTLLDLYGQEHVARHKTTQPVTAIDYQFQEHIRWERRPPFSPLPEGAEGQRCSGGRLEKVWRLGRRWRRRESWRGRDDREGGPGTRSVRRPV